MATRMQQRRGTAAQWISTNSGNGPILNAGEIGFESDTGKFKVGDGVNHWVDLEYFLNEAQIQTDIEGAISDTEKGAANGVATLDSNAKLTSSQLPDIAQVTVHAVANQAARLALSVEPGDIAIQSDNGQTYVLSATPASTNGNWTAITVADPFPTHDTDDLAEGTTNKYFTDERAQDAVGNSVGTGLSYNDSTGVISVDTTVMQERINNVSNTEIAYLDGLSSNIQNQLDNKAPIASPIFTGTVIADEIETDNDLTVGGNLIVNGTTTTVNSTEVNVQNAFVFEGISPNNYETTLSVVDPTDDRNIVLPDANGTVSLVDGTETLTNKTISATNNTITIAIEDLDGATLTTTELNYVDGVTSSIQTQLNGKSNNGHTHTISSINDITASASELNVLDGITVTTTEINYVTGATSSIQLQLDGKSETGHTHILTNITDINASANEINILDGVTVTTSEINTLDGVTSSIQTQLDGKSATGHTHTIANITDITASAAELNILDGATLTTTELNYVDGVTSSIQTQLDGKSATNHSHVLTDVTDITASAAEINVLDGITASTAELNYIDGVTSSIQTQLDGKSATGHTHTLANVTDVTASAAELNTLDGITASTAELNILDGVTASAAELNILDGATLSTTELNYVDGVTSAIQTQLDAKAPLASPTFTGTVTLPSGTVTSTMIADGTIVNADINASAAIELSKLATDPLARANHTGTQAAATISDFTSAVNAAASLSSINKAGANVNLNSNKIINLADPTSDQDAATKAYVDAATAGLNVHASVKAATTANITLATDVENGDTLDGVTLATGNRILIKNQTTQSQNGVYTVNATGAPTRATDYDSTPEVDAGDFIFVEGGTVNGKTGWVQTNVITTIGTDAIEFTQFSGSGTYTAGTGLSLTGTQFAIDSTVATLSGSQTLTNKTIDTGTFNKKQTFTADTTGSDAAATFQIPTGNSSAAAVRIFDTTGTTTAYIGNAGSFRTNSFITGGTQTAAGQLTIVGASAGIGTTSPIVYIKGITSQTNDMLAINNVSNTKVMNVDKDGNVNVATGNTYRINDTEVLSSTKVLGKTPGGTTAGDIATINDTQTLTNKTINLTSNTLVATSAQIASAVTDETGSGSLVFATSPTLVTPTLGVATATSVNGTTIPSSKTLVVTTDKLSVHAATTSAELAGVISDETGSGSLVFATSPTLVTPTLGAATATSITFSGDSTVQSTAGVPSLTTIVQKSASYTLSALTERDNLIEINSASGVTLTIPTNTAVAYPVGTSIDILQTGAGQITIAGDTGVTVNATPGLKLRAQWSSATLFKRATNTWVVMGDLSA